MPSSTRRALLAAAGLSAAAGCVSIDGLTGRSMSDPAPFLHEPTDWAHPSYDAGNTGAAPATAAPDSLAATPTWAAETEAVAVEHVHPPLVADGVVYLPLGGYDGGEEFERLVALDATTGEERWRRETPGRSALHTPVVARETVYWLTDTDRRLALNAADGSVRWERAGANHERPLAAHGVVLDVGTDGGVQRERLVARDPDTGAPYWERGSGEQSWSVHAAGPAAFYVTRDDEREGESPRLHAVDPTTGETRWATRISPDRVVVGPDHLFATDGGPDTRELVAFERRTGEVTWTLERDLQRPYDDGERLVNGRQPPAAITDDTLLVHVDFHGVYDDRLESRDPETSDVRWTYTGDGTEPVSFGRPVLAGDQVYLTAVRDQPGDGWPTGSLRVLSLTDGIERERVDLDHPSFVRPVVARGQCLVVDRGEAKGPSLTAWE